MADCVPRVSTAARLNAVLPCASIITSRAAATSVACARRRARQTASSQPFSARASPVRTAASTSASVSGQRRTTLPLMLSTRTIPQPATRGVRRVTVERLRPHVQAEARPTPPCRYPVVRRAASPSGECRGSGSCLDGPPVVTASCVPSGEIGCDSVMCRPRFEVQRVRVVSGPSPADERQARRIATGQEASTRVASSWTYHGDDASGDKASSR